jgi:CheY-like chemotaxis protein
MQKINKILLVDDDGAMNFLSKIILKKLDAAKEIEIAENGLVACKLVEQDDCPDIIFLDIKMPLMDGFDFLDSFEKMNRCKKVKIVMLTSSLRPEDQEKAFQYKSVVDYIEKPLTTEKVDKLMNRFFV